MTNRVVELPREYRGKFIAYKLDDHLEVIDSDEDLERLLEKLRRRGLDPRYIHVDYVPEEEVVYLI